MCTICFRMPLERLSVLPRVSVWTVCLGNSHWTVRTTRYSSPILFYSLLALKWWKVVPEWPPNNSFSVLMNISRFIKKRPLVALCSVYVRFVLIYWFTKRQQTKILTLARTPLRGPARQMNWQRKSCHKRLHKHANTALLSVKHWHDISLKWTKCMLKVQSDSSVKIYTWL